MKRAAWAFLLIALIAAGAVAKAALEPARPSAGPTLRLASFGSKAVRGRVHLVVLLPEGYASSAVRYPVVYFLHGLPASSQAYRNVGFLKQALDGLPRQAILVAPQAARDHDRDLACQQYNPFRALHRERHLLHAVRG